MADLVGHLGIARASIYATFGGKRDLYLKALERYLQTRNPNPVDLLSQPGPALPAIRALIEAYAGRLLPRFGTRSILAAGLLIAAGALLLLSVPGVPYAGLAVLPLGTSLVFSACVVSVMRHAGEHQASLAGTLVNTAMAAGPPLGVATATWLASARSHQPVTGYPFALRTAAILLLAFVLLMMITRRASRPPATGGTR